MSDRASPGPTKRFRGYVKATDASFGQIMQNWLEEEEDYDSNGSGSEFEDNISNMSDTEDDISASDDDDMFSLPASDVLHGKDGHVWSQKLPPKTKTPQRNLFLRIPGPKGAAKNVSTPEDAWNLLINDDMIDTIVFHTNKEIELRRARYNNDCRYVDLTNNVELRALIGLLYFAGCRKDGHLNVDEMWGSYGSEMYRNVMSKERFKFLIVCIRFDDRNTRNPQDKFAPIRSIWAAFISHATQYYTPHEYCTIDEQLLGFRGKCPFRVYIATKPDTYGLKIVCMCDSRTFYMVNALPYIGKEDRPQKNLPLHYVKTLSESIHGTRRNITMDNWFTSVPLADEMLHQHQLTIVGTLRKNKREIPPSFLPNKKKAMMSSQFCFDKKNLSVIHSQKIKSVILISTMHCGAEINENNGKPEIVNFYNSTKGGVDTFDQLMHTYSVTRKTRRWPLRYFYGILDQAGINGGVLYQSLERKCARKTFLFDLSLQLIKPHVSQRLSKVLPKELRNNIEKMIGCEKTVVSSDIQEKKNWRDRFDVDSVVGGMIGKPKPVV